MIWNVKHMLHLYHLKNMSWCSPHLTVHCVPGAHHVPLLKCTFTPLNQLYTSYLCGSLSLYIHICALLLFHYHHIIPLTFMFVFFHSCTVTIRGATLHYPWFFCCFLLILAHMFSLHSCFVIIVSRVCVQDCEQKIVLCFITRSEKDMRIS